jgi:hypothetical protein
MREGKPLKDYMLAFGDYPVTQPVAPQSVEYQEQLIDAWILGSNAIFEAKAKRQ